MYNPVPRNETVRTAQTSNVSVQEGPDMDLMVNNLVYEQPAALSLQTSRAYHRQYFNVNSYRGGQTMLCDFNAGSNVIGSENSYLTFEITLELVNAATPTRASFGSASAAAVCREITINSRDATELDRTTRANVWSRNHCLYTYPRNYLTTIGLVEGFTSDLKGDVTGIYGIDQFTNTSDGVNADVPEQLTRRFCVKLCNLSPFFSNINKGQPLPAALASGLQLQIILEDFRTVFYSKLNPANISGYTINNVQVVTDNIGLTDDTMKMLNDDSARTGLEVAFTSVHTSGFSLKSTETLLNFQVRKSVSQAERAYVVILNSDNTKNTARDSFASYDYNVSELQYRLASVYYPKEVIKDPNYNGAEAYMLALKCFNKIVTPFQETSVSYDEYKGDRAVYAVQLSKNSDLAASGVPTNNSRVLEMNAVLNPGPSEAEPPKEALLFLYHMKVTRAWVNNVAVAE